MKFNHKQRLTFGDLIASIYRACTPREAKALLRLAVNGRVVVFRGSRRFVIA